MLQASCLLWIEMVNYVARVEDLFRLLFCQVSDHQLIFENSQ